ncbi:hypothetical protein KC318_g5337 [Hortaea werneckii]|nr:hypothetical protein KC334_g5430 [Hortaea werneckii]KAI7025167.1 hypothetical protein KC355_g1140 [Hortaea werneckii]KAI7187048.1 hypothetical protein KC324_g7006 [Hortaea werneckii]KAI7668337.1 hypothetical protein KC318_g5337 [Hortaea werneckii]
MASTFCVGQVVRGRKGLYRITQKLHHQVWGASCAAHDHIVLKCAYPKRVQREKEVLQRFEGHASIRQLLDFAENPPCLVLEHLQVDALRSATKAPISRQNIKTIARSILSALESLHANGIIHTDIKPDNILLNYGQEGTTVVEAKLADYGDAYEADLTRHPHGAAHVIGAGIFRSPEVLLGLHLSTSTDIWSFGATLISLLWGRGFHIFKPVAGVTADDAEFPAHVLMEQARYFGPFPLRYQELLDEESESILAAIHVLIEQEGTRKPFLLVEDEEIQLEDKEFLCDIMRLDPLERPTASDLLKHRWFDVL